MMSENVKLTYYFLFISITNNVKSYKMKGLKNSKLQCFYNGRSLTERSSLLKTKKTRKTKTYVYYSKF